MDYWVQLGFVLIGVALQAVYDWARRTTQEYRGTLTGEWEEYIFDKDEKPENREKQDIVICKQRGEIVEAEITRIRPPSQKGRKWHFSGRYKEGVIFGHFWSNESGNLSFGSIYLRPDGGVYSGYYIRQHREPRERTAGELRSFRPTQIHLVWRKRGTDAPIINPLEKP